MLFNSGIFLLWFLPLTLVTYYSVAARHRTLLLAIAGYIFYGWWNPLFTSLMFTSTVVDFVAGRGIAAASIQSKKRLYLILSLAANLSLLGFFKYSGMLGETLNALTGGSAFPVLHLILPVGISFYTFQSMSYSIDIYRGNATPTKSFIDFACYVSLFPQLVAGPIVRYSEIADQLQHRQHTWDGAAEGIYRFVIGLAKKVLIADLMASLADAAFASSSLSAFDAWVGILAYAFQIYFDFSGYSDMAIGLGLLFGFRFPENFNLPYLANGIGDFWHRWHMTLSRWLRDYLYIPLGGSRHGKILTLRNLIITMFLGGLWHGAAWTFVVWGLYHGVLLVLERLFGHLFVWLPLSLKRFTTFLFVLFGWVLFRSTSFEQSIAYFQSLFTGSMSSSIYTFHLAVPIILFGVVAVLLEHVIPRRIERYNILNTTVILTLFLVSFFVLLGNTASPFLYFQF